MDSLAIKCYLISSNQEREIRRFSLDAEVVGNYAYLQEKIRCVYPQLIRESFKLSYMDEEDDKITFSSDDEFISALMFAKRKDDQPFHLFVHLAGETKASPPISEPEFNCGEVTHFGVTCDGCQGKVAGFRYKCLQCFDYDLCGKCEAKGVHSQHYFIRTSGPLPACWMGMKKLLEGSGSGHCPRRNTFRGPGSGRMGRGHCRFTIPRGIDVEIDPKAGKDAPVKEEQPNPLTDHAKNLANAAKVFQEIAGNEYLQNFGNTISSILEQFVPVLVPDTVPNCPPGCFKPENKDVEKEKKIPAPDVTIKTEQNTDKEDNGNKPTSQDVLKKEDTVQEKSASASRCDEIPAVNPYAPLVEAALAVGASVAADAMVSSTESVSSPVSTDWTIVENVNQTAEVSSSVAADGNNHETGNCFGARSKTPLVVEEDTALHPDPLVSALETMLAMGFTNEGGWLAQLIRVKNGDIGQVLDVLHTRHQRK